MKRQQTRRCRPTKVWSVILSTAALVLVAGCAEGPPAPNPPAVPITPLAVKAMPTKKGQLPPEPNVSARERRALRRAGKEIK